MIDLLYINEGLKRFNNLDWALMDFCKINDFYREKRLLAVNYVLEFKYYNLKIKKINALNAAIKFANNSCSVGDLEIARFLSCDSDLFEKFHDDQEVFMTSKRTINYAAYACTIENANVALSQVSHEVRNAFSRYYKEKFNENIYLNKLKEVKNKQIEMLKYLLYCLENNIQYSSKICR